MAGRPEAHIDWKQVDKLLEAGADGVQIAARLGVHPTTLYNHCEETHKTNFSLYSQEKRASGDALLHVAQFNKAMKGDAGMLKWLGIYRLGQKEVTLDEIEDASRRGAAEAVREIEAENRARAGASSRSNMEDQQSLLDKGCSGESDQVSDELGSEGAL